MRALCVQAVVAESSSANVVDKFTVFYQLFHRLPWPGVPDAGIPSWRRGPYWRRTWAHYIFQIGIMVMEAPVLYTVVMRSWWRCSVKTLLWNCFVTLHTLAPIYLLTSLSGDALKLMRAATLIHAWGFTMKDQHR